MGNDPRTLKQTLIPASRLLSRYMLDKRVIDLDEHYLHTTLSSWAGKNDLERMLVISSAMSATRCIGFTVRFNERKQKSLASDIPKAFRKLRNELVSLNALGPCMMTLEKDQAGRLHVHGLIATDTEAKRLRDVLRQLGGYSSDARFRNCFQVDTKVAFNPLCWTHYMLKDLVRLPPPARQDWFYISRAAANLGETHLPVLRRLALDKLGVKPELRGRATVFAARASMGASAIHSATRH